MDSYRDPDLDLDGLLEDAVDRFEQAVEGRYENSEDGRFVTQFAQAIARLIETTAADLSDAKYAEMWRVIAAGRLDRVELTEDVQFALQARLARKVIDTSAMTRRSFDLLKLVAQASPPEAVLRFLRRASRCYVLGLVPECLVMCRASFENALKTRYKRERIPYPPFDTMRVRAKGAVARGWLSADVETRGLQLVWHRGNKAAHEDPDAVGNPLEAMGVTMEAIEQLHAV